MIAWMIYATLVALALGAAAFTAERAARVRRRATRWVWLIAMLGSLALPALISSVTLRLPGMLQSGAMPPPVVLRDVTSIPMPALLMPLDGSQPYGAPDPVAMWLRTGWLVLSVLALCALLVGAALLQRRKRGWREATMCGEHVLVAADAGPAVAGLWQPRIVVPAWLLQASEQQQRDVLAHERSHLEAGDPRLIALAVTLLALMPWNPLLWWQFHRLRRAIEVDCDARVLRGGRDPVAYCETLLHVGQCQSSRIGLVPAMSESGSFLEQRIKLMLTRRNKWAGVSALVLVCASLGMTVFAAQVTPPGGAAPEVKDAVTLPPTVLDRYVGFYKIGAISRVAVTRSGNGLVIAISAQMAAPRPFYAVPLGADRFAVQGKPAIAHFVMDASGHAQRMVLEMHGETVLDTQRIDATEAGRIDAALAKRIRDEQPYPGSLKALQLLLRDPVDGAGMSKDLAKIRQKQRTSREQYLAELGPVLSYTFTGVNQYGDDVYSVKHAHGTETIALVVDPDGTLARAFRHR
ncbi:M56 family metallopeptidase [Dyella ginsengisoli]|uniref:M56 family metallopeptidase n=1 Tax=Dyella ginsengisoli TaxID=363848 RepID=UPI00034C64EF|nr:M56 family metallopeptidase [Dyella ginsengisoli]